MYDFILFENFHSAFHHKYDVYLIARLLKSKGFKVAILNIYGEDKADNYPNIDLIELPFKYMIPDDKSWIDYKGTIIKRLYYVIRFLIQQQKYMAKVRSFIEDKAENFYLGSYHLLMPFSFFSLKKPCYYWGLRSSRMTNFGGLFVHNPFLALRMIRLRNHFFKNGFQSLFVSNEIIKNEFINIGVPEERLILREERCIEERTSFNSDNKDLEFSLLVIGGLRRQKKIETTIKAFKKASIQDGYLYLIGKCQDDSYEKIIIDEIGESDNIYRINCRLDYDTFNNYMKRAHFTLFADEKGNSSVTNGTLMESVINFTPFIAPDYEPYSSYVKKYGIGITYRPGDVEDYARTLCKARELGYSSFINNITEFQKNIEFDFVANKLYNSLRKRELTFRK